uniref:Uncharacterized protein n=1 Tax=Eutreptiella gymnastica TaxID=73025 RepID=A0A7S1IR30_9EUGL
MVERFFLIFGLGLRDHELGCQKEGGRGHGSSQPCVMSFLGHFGLQVRTCVYLWGLFGPKLADPGRELQPASSLRCRGGKNREKGKGESGKSGVVGHWINQTQ